MTKITTSRRSVLAALAGAPAAFGIVAAGVPGAASAQGAGNGRGEDRSAREEDAAESQKRAKRTAAYAERDRLLTEEARRPPERRSRKMPATVWR